MSGFIGELLEGIVSYVTDVWMLRRHRAVRGRPENALSKDATDVVLFDAWVLWVSILAMAGTLVMLFLLKLPFWICMAPLVAGGVYVGFRWMALVRA